MNAVYALLAVAALSCVGILVGASAEARAPVAVVVPYAACAIFLVGILARVWRWAATPVPFRIPTTCGQQKSLGWIKPATLDNPATGAAAAARMALEVLLFRSLFRNTRCRIGEGKATFGENKYLWLAAMGFHWSLLVILLRHLRLLIEPVPGFVMAIERIDGLFQIGHPVMYGSDVILVAALLYLLVRRFREPLVRYISLFTDYFALFLLLGIALSGVLMRHLVRADVAGLKQFALGLVTFHPVAPPALSPVFLVHLLLVSTLAAYFPFSKLVHMGGVFLSPTRNLANNNRSQRHINPWNYPVKTHSYLEWEEEFRDKIKAAGLPLEVEAEHGGKTTPD
ncbi:MAG: sulfate reduction electron transfer complex DsrMKJOP subunit DsrM [Candidatus Korobacteraceae bacterium]